MVSIGAVAQSTEVTIGDGTSTGYYLPANMYYNYSLTQQIYTADEIGMAGTISAISFDYSNSSSFTMSGIKVFMMNTDKSSFASSTDMVAITGATLVYEGVFSATGSGWANITLDTPFEYNGEDNLLVCVYDPTNGYPGSSFKFKYTTTTEYTSIAYYSDSYVPSLDDVSSFSGSTSRYQYHNNIKFEITPAPAPTCPRPTELAASEIATRGAHLSWTNGGEETSWQICLNGNEDNLISATTNPFDLTNLTPETAYSVKVRAVCGENDNSNWSSPVNFTTLPSCLAPTALAYTDVTTNSVILSWTAGASEEAWQICINNNEDALVNVTENPYTLTELDPATTYSIKVRANCGDVDGNSQWTSAVQFTTPCEAIAVLPYTEDFEDFTANNTPDCWDNSASSSSTLNGSSSYYIWGVYSYNNNKMIRMCNYWVESGTALINSQPISIPAEGTYLLTFKYSHLANCGAFTVKISTDGGTSFTNLGTYSATSTSYSYTNPGTFREIEEPISLSDYAGETIILQFFANSNYGSGAIFIDDVTVREASSEAEILTYSLPTQASEATITSGDDNGTIEVTVANSTDFDVDLTPTYTISEHATISDPVITGEGDVRTIAYTVTAEAGNTKDWTVTVTKAPVNHDAFITAFSFASQKEGTEAVIVSEDETYTVNAVAVWDADLTAIAPVVTISNAATVVPESGAEQDFSEPVEYTVTAEDGTTTHTYTVTIVNDPDACINPATVSISNITTTIATLSWAQAYTETSYLVKVSTEAMTDMTATADVFDGTVEATTKELEGLTSNTQYFVYVQSNCDNAEGWTLSSFTTACDAIVEFPWSENFDDLSANSGSSYNSIYDLNESCWVNEHISGSGSYLFEVSAYNTQSGNATNQLRLPDMYSGTFTMLVLPVMNIPTEGSYIFGIDVYRNSYYTVDAEEGIRIFASTNGEIEGATELAFIPRQYSSSSSTIDAVSEVGWYTYNFGIPFTGTCYIILRGESKYRTATYMDNFIVREVSTEAEIVDFNFPTRMSAPVIDSEAATVTATASYQADLENLDETVTVSEAAEYVENTATVEGNVKTFTYTVTAEDGTTTKDWTVIVTKAESASTANDIVAFSFVGQVGESVIDPEAKTVTAYAEWDFDFENNDIAPEITVSPMATINPASGVAQNFNAPVQYAVTAEDGESVANWTVTITNDPNACVNPAEVNVVSVTETTAALSWDKMYLETSYLVKVSTEPMDDMTAEADVYDDEVELEGDAAALALTGLTPATIYYVYVQSNCGAEDWTISYFATECDGSAYPVPFVETFETSSALCWTVIDANNDAEDWGGIYGGAWNIGDLIGDGNIIGGYVYSPDNDANDWLISPKIAIVDGAYLTFDYAGYSSYYTEKFSVYVMDDPANYASATQILTTQIVETTDYASIANIDLSAYADQEIYIGIKCESEADQDALFIDNFKVVLPVYTITATAGENGTIDPASAEVMYGYDQAFTITPAEGYRIESVVVDAETENEDDVTEEELVAGDGVFFYTFENVTANHTINVTFEEIPTYTITVDAGENGTVLYNDALVSEPITVNEGATPEFVITPATGYQIEALTVGGETVELTAEQLGGYTYTFEPVMADVTLVVTFEAIPVTTYTITLTVGEHGTVTYNGEEVEGEVTVEEGATPAFVITPAENYQIDVLTVGGVTVAVADANLLGFTYIFEAVTANTSLSVTFVEVGSAEMLEAGSMAIYPNPNNGMFSIDFSNIEGDATYQLIDARGAVVETRDINVMSGETMNFNHNLRPGAYFVRIINGDKVYVEQIVVE